MIAGIRCMMLYLVYDNRYLTYEISGTVFNTKYHETGRKNSGKQITHLNINADRTEN